MNRTVELVAEGFSFLEGPVYDPGTGSLLVADLDGGGVWRFRDGVAPENVAPGVARGSGIAWHESRALVLAPPALRVFDGSRRRFLPGEATRDGVRRYND